jgi:hypothetical protein
MIGPIARGRAAVAATVVVLVIAGCSGGGGGSSGTTQQAGEPDATPAAAAGGGAASVPDPCTLLTSDDVTGTLAKAGYPGNYGPGTLNTSNPNDPRCVYEEPGPASLTAALDVCSATMCDFGIVKSMSGGAGAVSGVGDDAFFFSACDGPGLVPDHQLWATAKGLVFQLNLACHTESALSAGGTDQAMTDLMKLAISRA